MQWSQFFERVGYVTLKLTNGCNLKCTYCNVEAVTPQTPKMSLELFKQVATLLIENSKQPFLGLEFHGGEPLLHDDEWFEEAVGFARELARTHRKHVEFPLVTNGTLLTEERLERLDKLGIQFCISCDGPPEINDLLRASGHAVERTIKMLRGKDVYSGIITVLSQSNYERLTEIMDWFDSIGVNDFRVNFVQPQGRGMDAVLLNGEQLFDGMIQVLDHMYLTDVKVHEAEMATYVQRFLDGRDANPSLTCWEVECQAGRTYVALDLTGRVHACGTDLTNHPIGHISRDLDEVDYQQKMNVLHDKGDWVIRCFDCPAKRICNHSCPTSDFNSDMYKEYECDFTKRLWTHLCEHPEKAERIGQVLASRKQLQPEAFVPSSVLEFSSLY